MGEGGDKSGCWTNNFSPASPGNNFSPASPGNFWPSGRETFTQVSSLLLELGGGGGIGSQTGGCSM